MFAPIVSDSRECDPDHVMSSLKATRTLMTSCSPYVLSFAACVMTP